MKINIMNIGVTYVWFSDILIVQNTYECEKIKCIDYVLCMLKNVCNPIENIWLETIYFFLVASA